MILTLSLCFIPFNNAHAKNEGSNQWQEQKASSLQAATLLQTPMPLSDFTLMATHGKSFNLQSLKGHWSLLFFGYSDCPDICPRTLNKVSDIYKILSEERMASNDSSISATSPISPRFIFISLNSTQDNIEKLKSFLSRFDPQFMGLTGDETEINKLAKSCRIYSWTDPKLNSLGQKVIDHSATLILINPKGQIQALFSPPHEPRDIAKDIQSITKS